MSDELTDQLRRYADALEDHLASPQAAPVAPMSTRRRRRQLLAAAAAAIVVAVGAGAYLVTGDDDKAVPVTSGEGRRTSTTTRTTAVDDATSTTVDRGRPTATTVPVGPTTTATPPREARLRGSADWPGRDPRGALYVGACPSIDTGVACRSMRVAPVAADGSFDLTLPPVSPGTTWRVAAYVNVEDTPWQPCVFSCAWANAPLNVVRGEVLTVDANVDQTLALAVSARVVDVFVRDRNGDPFPGSADANDRFGGGVQATDMRCSNSGICPEEMVQMFRLASPIDGATRLVVNPDVRYDFHGQALNMRSQGWTDPQWTNNDDEFWFSPDEAMSGAELDEGHVFRVNGAPANSSSS